MKKNNSTIKIAMIGQKGMPAVQGGIERHVHDVSIRLFERGFAPTVYSRAWYTGKKQSVYNGVKTPHIWTINTKCLDAIVHSFLSTMHAIVTRQDVIHYHGVGPALVSWIPRVFAPWARVVVTMHGIDRLHAKWNGFARFMLKRGERAACTFAHETITVSDELHAYAKLNYGVETTSIPNGVDLYEKVETTKALETFDLTAQEYFLIVARLVPNKGIHHAIDAFLEITEDKVPGISNKKLVIVGDSCHTDAYVQMLKKKAKKSDRIVFTGFQTGEALDELYSHAIALVHPSEFEGLSLTVLEAMSYGLPVLASRIPGLLQLIDNEVYTFEVNDVASFTDTWIAIMRLRQFDREREGFRNRKKIERMYTWETVVDQLQAVYTKVLEKKKVSEPAPAANIS